MNILVINCGSSSLKYQLINSDSEAVLAKGLCERIGIDGSVLTHTPAGKDKVRIETPMPNHTVAVQLVIDALTNAEHGVIKSLDEIGAVGHRVVHGGEKFAAYGEDYYPLALGEYDRMILMVYYLESVYGTDWVTDGQINYTTDPVSYTHLTLPTNSLV